MSSSGIGCMATRNKTSFECQPGNSSVQNGEKVADLVDEQILNSHPKDWIVNTVTDNRDCSLNHYRMDGTRNQSPLCFESDKELEEEGSKRLIGIGSKHCV